MRKIKIKMVIGAQKKQNIFENYIGKYIVVFPQHSSTFSGKLDKIEEGWLVLNPHQFGDYDENKGITRKLVYEDTIIRISDIVAIEPTTKKNLEKYCLFLNNEDQKKSNSQTTK